MEKLKEKFEFGSVSGTCDASLEDFILVEDADYHKSYISKKVYEHRETGLNFDYKYVLHGSFWEGWAIEEVFGIEEDFEDPPLTIDIYMVPVLDSLSDESISDIMSAYGWEGEWKNFETDFIEYIIVEAGYGMRMDGSGDLIRYEDMDKEFFNAANAITAIDGLFGFYMDQVVNGIGTTNWDLLEERLGVIDNAFSVSLERTAEKMGL
jgi:hypothetical protein